MFGFGRHSKTLANPPRPPDPDPVVEARLQQLEELARQNAFKQTQAEDYRAEIAKLHTQLHKLENETVYGGLYTSTKAKEQVAASQSRIIDLQTEIRQLEADIQANHDKIVAIQQKLVETRNQMIYGINASPLSAS